MTATNRTGTYKLRYRGRRSAAVSTHDRFVSGSTDDVGTLLQGIEDGEHRTRRIVESLREEILEGGGGSNLRIRCVFRSPREIFRLELSLPEMGYQRTTLLDREALEQLLAADDVREVVETAALGG